MSLFKLMLLLTILTASNLAVAYTAALYEQGSGKKKLLYNMTVDIANGDDGKFTAKATFKDAEGNLALEQNVILQGSQIVRDETLQKQLDQVGLIEVKDGKVFFTKTADGKTSTKEEDLEQPFVTSGNFQKFVKDNWSEIMKGETISFRYGVWDRQETVGFKIFKVSEEKNGDTTVVSVKMKPSSFIIAAIVKPILFKLPSDGARIVEMNGRVAPKIKDGSKWKDLDAEVVYSY